MAEDATRYSHLCQLERDLASMSNNPCPDLDEAALDTCQRPVRYFFGQVGTLKEATKVVGQCMKLQPDRVVAEPLAGRPCPVDRVFAFLDVLFGCAALIVEADDLFRFHWQFGDDKAHAREQITRVPLDLCDDAAGLIP